MVRARSSQPHLSLFGGPLDTGNLGVSALGTSVLEGANRHGAEASVTVFDNGWGRRDGTVTAGDLKLDFQRVGARLSKRYHRPESLLSAMVAARLRLHRHPLLEILNRSTAVLDVSGGDSFTDMYGSKRFAQVTVPKQLTLRLDLPLVLLPQTYGPFYGEDTLRTATDVVRRASMAWARDERSFEQLKTMLGTAFDADRHRLGVDMAFDLTPTKPSGPQAEPLIAWLAEGGPVAGLNVSGLLYGPTPDGVVRDPIAIDYDHVTHQLMTDLLAEPDTRLLLVPHVLGSGPETDEAVVRQALSTSGVDPDRVRVVPTAGLTANEAKWWISQCDWFCGARMHSTIAGLSSGVPTAALAYSIKTGPVFATVGQEQHVVDARTSTNDDAIASLIRSWQARSETREHLAPRAAHVRAKARQQMDDLIDEALGSAG